ncbi:hypothetical protein DFH08DRAFT_838999 [Mycena albidolilacea]|uniref:Uncharacterized protein n=1 Tax=Mycena albidolilacea TaxID=1033008 RepID=A0AAD7APM5_9AGAR|nr:hypothetical protein DFH08DRAFT_838999 [Mycena albidolilacea]
MFGNPENPNNSKRSCDSVAPGTPPMAVAAQVAVVPFACQEVNSRSVSGRLRIQRKLYVKRVAGVAGMEWTKYVKPETQISTFCLVLIARIIKQIHARHSGSPCTEDTSTSLGLLQSLPTSNRKFTTAIMTCVFLSARGSELTVFGKICSQSERSPSMADALTMLVQRRDAGKRHLQESDTSPISSSRIKSRWVQSFASFTFTFPSLFLRLILDTVYLFPFVPAVTFLLTLHSPALIAQSPH